MLRMLISTVYITTLYQLQTKGVFTQCIKIPSVTSFLLRHILHIFALRARRDVWRSTPRLHRENTPSLQATRHMSRTKSMLGDRSLLRRCLLR